MVGDPLRSYDYDMVELRLYQLSVTSNCRVPTEEAVEYTAPVKTTQQEKSITHRILTTESYTTAIDALNEGATNPEPYWTFPWPVLHIPVSIIGEKAILVFCFALDILCDIAIEWFSIEFPFECNVGDLQLSAMAAGAFTELFTFWGGQIGVFGLALRLALQGIDILAAHIPPVTPAYAAIAILYGSWLITFASWIYAVMAAVDEGYMHPIAAAVLFFAFAASMFKFLGNDLWPSCRTVKELWKEYKMSDEKLWKEAKGAKLLMTVISIIVKVSVFVTSMVLFFYYINQFASVYGWW